MKYNYGFDVIGILSTSKETLNKLLLLWASISYVYIGDKWTQVHKLKLECSDFVSALCIGLFGIFKKEKN